MAKLTENQKLQFRFEMLLQTLMMIRLLLIRMIVGDEAGKVSNVFRQLNEKR